MKSKTVTILTSVLVGSLLATLATAQQPSSVLGRRGVINKPERPAAQTTAPATPKLMVYAFDVAFHFGSWICAAARSCRLVLASRRTWEMGWCRAPAHPCSASASRAT